MKYALTLKTNGETVTTTDAKSENEALAFFAQRKNLTVDTLLTIYKIKRI